MGGLSQNLSNKKRLSIFPTQLDKHKAILITYIAFLFTGFQCAIYGMLTVSIAKHFQISPSNVIFYDGFGLWGQIFAMATGGIVIRKIKAKNTLALAALLMIIGSTFSILAINIYVYSLMSFLCNMAVGYVLLTCNYMTMGTVTSEGESEGKLSILNVFFSFGFLASASIVGILLHYFNWQVVFLSIMILFSVFILFLLLIRINELIETQLRQQTEDKINNKKPTFQISFLNLASILIAISLFCIVYVEQIMNYFNQPHLHYKLGFDIQTVGILVSSYTLAQLLGRILFGKFLLPKIKIHLYLITATILFAILFCLYLSLHSFLMVFLIMAALGLADSCIYPSILGFGMDQLPNLSSSATSFFVTVGAIGIPIGTSVSGLLGDYFGHYTAMAIGPILLVIISLLIYSVHLLQMKNKNASHLAAKAS
ncbi:MFS transporter [Thiotrichales bacterium 19S3-7]|nr:MFS transporter [Thiotrichales bacterium 19S3-7]MCF6801202.1 MFS transporter [Thiotrichales bacterium 19S3-11]